jgi:hypothetical protein
MEDEKPAPVHAHLVRMNTGWWSRSKPNSLWYYHAYHPILPGAIRRGQCIEIAESFDPVNPRKLASIRRSLNVKPNKQRGVR